MADWISYGPRRVLGLNGMISVCAGGCDHTRRSPRRPQDPRTVQAASRRAGERSSEPRDAGAGLVHCRPSEPTPSASPAASRGSATEAAPPGAPGRPSARAATPRHGRSIRPSLNERQPQDEDPHGAQARESPRLVGKRHGDDGVEENRHGGHDPGPDRPVAGAGVSQHVHRRSADHDLYDQVDRGRPPTATGAQHQQGDRPENWRAFDSDLLVRRFGNVVRSRLRDRQVREAPGHLQGSRSTRVVSVTAIASLPGADELDELRHRHRSPVYPHDRLHVEIQPL